MIRIGIIALILFFSCTQKTKIPEDILPPDKMEKLLMDMLRAEEFLNQRQPDSATLDSFNRIKLYQSVLALHKMTKENFKKSFTFYEAHPDLLKTVLDSMHSEVARVDSQTKMPPKIKKPLKK
jgi:hypothetical protein